MRVRLTLAMTAAAILVAVSAPSAQTDPFAGTWKLNVAKSSYNPGPAPKSGIVTISTEGSTVRVVVDGVGPTGEKVHWEYAAASHDGKEYKIVGNNADADTVALKRLGPRSVEVSNKLKGKPTTVNIRTVSADGKTMTVTTKGLNAAGQTVSNVQMFEK
jgi:hypothetical protein